jgi:hypothetical protein
VETPLNVPIFRATSNEVAAVAAEKQLSREMRAVNKSIGKGRGMVDVELVVR